MNYFKHYFFIFFVFVFLNPTFGLEIYEVNKLQSSNVDLIPNYKNDPPLKSLKFLSGLEITGNHSKFGGLSGLVLSSNFDFFKVDYFVNNSCFVNPFHYLSVFTAYNKDADICVNHSLLEE